MCIPHHHQSHFNKPLLPWCSLTGISIYKIKLDVFHIFRMFDFVSTQLIYYQCNIHISITLLFKFTFTSSITSPLTLCNFNLQLFQHSFFCHSSVPCLDAYALIIEHNFRNNGLIVRKINL